MNLKKDKWERVKLGDVCEIDSSRKEIINIPNELIVSFVEMADLDDRRTNTK